MTAPKAPKDERRERRVMINPKHKIGLHFYEEECWAGDFGNCVDANDAEASEFRASQAGEDKK